MAATATIRLHFDFADRSHTFADIIQGGWLTSHEPDGDWLYGADIGVHPDYRGKGLAQALYAARQELVWALGLKGQVTAGMMSGFGAVKHRMSAEDYYEGLVAGRINDPDALHAARASGSSSERCSRTTCRIRSATITACSSCSMRPRTSRALCRPDASRPGEGV